MRRRLAFLAVTSLSAVLMMALVYFRAGAESYPVAYSSLSLGSPAQNPPQGHFPSTGGINPGGAATATPTVCAGGSPGAWAVRSPLPTDAFGVAVAGDGTYAYAFGGYRFSVPGAINQVSRYDPVADTWVSRASIPVVTYDAVAVNGNNGNIYVFGGTDATNVYNTTRIYNIGSDTWSTGAPMPGNRQQMGSGYYNGKIYIVGGFDTTSVSPQSQTWEYTIASNSWATKTSVPQALGGPGSGVIGTHLYVAGGRDSTNVARNILYDYDIVADSWATRANLPTGVNVPGSGVITGKLAIFGGGNPFLDGSTPHFPANLSLFTTGSTQLYDPVTNTWSPLSNLNVARSFIGGATVGQYLVAIGGYNGTTSVNTNEVSSTGICSTNTPTITPTNTNTPTITPTATVVLTGHVTWQNIPQPSIRSVRPITLTLKMGTQEIDYPTQNTDQNGLFAVDVAGLPDGTWNWRVKGTTFLATCGTLTLPPSGTVDMGTQLGGDANNDNVVNSQDFNILKITFGKSVGDPGYDPRADFNNDDTVNIADFSILKGTFGQTGCGPIS